MILFIFFAILYVEVFGLTKWGGKETPTTNYYSLGNAMLMLSFQSTGFVRILIPLVNVHIFYLDREGWNQYMHDL